MLRDLVQGPRAESHGGSGSAVQVLHHLFLGVDLIYLYDDEDEPTYHK
jgi:hypothetical protein